MSRRRSNVTIALLWLMAVACSSEAPKKSLGDGCTLNSDCSGSLVCTFGRCHTACVTTKDCPTGESCIKDSSNNAVCQLPTETKCTKDNDCATPLVCGADGNCRGPCTKDSDCTPGQKCSTNLTCAEPSQVDNNNNLIVGDGGVGGSSGTGGKSSVGTTTAAGGSSNAGGTTSNASNGGGNSAIGGITGTNPTGGTGAIAGASNGGASNTGGATAVGGASNLGGTKTQGGASNAGGTFAVGGTFAGGGAVNVGGTTNSAGAVSTGGTKAAGGTSNVGTNTSVGGITSVGGTTNLGGAGPTGGVFNGGGTLGTGGTVNAGGAQTTGGIVSAGGSTGAGGAATGGATGGTLPTGGAAATGGTPGSGGMATGGSTSGASYVPTGCSVPSTTTRYFCDDFESGLSNWTLSGQDWGATSTTSRSPNNSFTDSPAGNYAPGTNAAALLSGSIDPTQATAPILMFWHKLALNNGSTYVEVSKDGGLNWSQLATYSIGSNTSTWLLQQLDLKSYVGSKIKLRLRLQDTNTSPAYVADGWYVDDIEVTESDINLTPPNTAGGCPAATTTRYFCDSFEAGLANWWVSGQDWNTTVATSLTGTHAFTDSPDGSYLPGADAAAELAGAVDLSNATAPIVSFWHKLALNNGSTYVEVSKDGGLNWSQLATYSIGSNTSTWLLQQLDLKSYVGSKIKLRLRLQDTNTSSSYVADGWYVDDVDIHELN